MYSAIIWPTILASALALPSPHFFTPRQSWSPAPGSVAKCHESDKIISFYVGPQKETVLNDACAAMMPDCAYQERHPGVICTQVMDWPLNGAKNSTQSANVEDASNGNKLSPWKVKFSVTPAESANSTSPIMWTKADCCGYFDTLVSKTSPEGCLNSMGSGIGDYTVGGDTPLRGAVFKIEIIAVE